MQPARTTHLRAPRAATYGPRAVRRALLAPAARALAAPGESRACPSGAVAPLSGAGAPLAGACACAAGRQGGRDAPWKAAARRCVLVRAAVAPPRGAPAGGFAWPRATPSSRGGVGRRGAPLGGGRARPRAQGGADGAPGEPRRRGGPRGVRRARLQPAARRGQRGVVPRGGDARAGPSQEVLQSCQTQSALLRRLVHLRCTAPKQRRTRIRVLRCTGSAPPAPACDFVSTSWQSLGPVVGLILSPGRSESMDSALLPFRDAIGAKPLKYVPGCHSALKARPRVRLLCLRRMSPFVIPDVIRS